MAEMSDVYGAAEEDEVKYSLLCKKPSVVVSSGKTVLLYWNVWSIQNETKLQNLLQILDDMNVGIACICETWFTSKKGVFS